VHEAFYNGSESVDVRLYFFPLEGDVMDPNMQIFIKESFTQQKISYSSPFKPEIVTDVSPSQGSFFPVIFIGFFGLMRGWC